MFCEFCERQFNYETQLSLHIIEVHGERNVECPICNRTFYNQKTLQDHIDGIHKKSKNYKCDFCHKLSTTASEHNRHVKYKHNNVPKVQVICNKCDKPFSSKPALNNHVKRLHTETSNLMKCDVCNKTVYKFDLSKHKMTVHEKKFAVRCKKCGKEFLSPKNLESHIKSIHENIRDHICEFCNQSFSRAWILGNHIKAIHDNVKN